MLYNRKKHSVTPIFLFVAFIGLTCCLPGPSTMKINGVLFNYKESGMGQPIIFLHGGPGFGMETIEPFLADIPGTRSIFFDQRGCGDSLGRFDFGKMNVEQAVNDLEGVVNNVGEGSLVIAAHDFGVFPAILFAYRYPEKVKALILISPEGLSGEYEELYQEKKSIILGTEHIKPASDFLSPGIDVVDMAMTDLINSRLAPDFYNASNIPKDLVNDFSFLVDSGMRYSLDYEIIRQALGHAELPVYIIYGENDIYPLESIQDYSDIVERLEVYSVPQSGRFPYIERNQYCVELIQGILKRT